MLVSVCKFVYFMSYIRFAWGALMFMWVCILVHVVKCANVCMWRSEVEARFYLMTLTFFFKAGPSLNLELIDLAGLADELLVSTPVPFITRVTDEKCCAWGLFHVS